jgi:hypothetical protein
MIALTVRQPWLWAILHAGKRIENRTWATRYRGPILLHAAKGCTQEEYVSAVESMILARVIDGGVPPLAEMQRGGIVGRARIVDVIEPVPYTRLWHGRDVRWHVQDQFGFVLADVEPLPFVPCKGALGLFRLNDDGTTPARESAQ